MTKLPDKRLAWPICWEGVTLIAQSEGCRLTAYTDIAGVWTLGWGETLNIAEGMAWTQTEADARLCERLTEFDDGVAALLTVRASDYERAALVSLAYNIGLKGFRKSSVLRLHNQGRRADCAQAFHLWNKAGGKVIKGLVSRRAREAALYLRQTASEAGDSLAERSVGAGCSPDADPPKPLTASRTIQSGAASVVTGSLALASQYSPQVGQIARSLSLNPVVVVALVAILAGAVVIWRRCQQRKGGTA
ncbi:MAG: lysozyme [Zoogloeaceae bacterium]|jgi:lysozyme|nr:lysozyme [Zoogloeaceae bacterium]